MANVKLTFACGHSMSEHMPGHAAKYRQGKAAQQMCWPCRCDAENSEATAQAEEAGLPPLVGRSDRQRAYGESCRASLMPHITDKRMPESERVHFLSWLASKTDASWWCDLKSQGLYTSFLSTDDGRASITSTVLAKEYHEETGRQL